MDRYVQMQALHTATLNALADSREGADGFNISSLGDHTISDGSKAEFDKNIAEAVAGENQLYDNNGILVPVKTSFGLHRHGGKTFNVSM